LNKRRLGLRQRDAVLALTACVVLLLVAAGIVTIARFQRQPSPQFSGDDEKALDLVGAIKSVLALLVTLRHGACLSIQTDIVSPATYDLTPLAKW
jgi:hypothetical protein